MVLNVQGVDASKITKQDSVKIAAVDILDLFLSLISTLKERWVSKSEVESMPAKIERLSSMIDGLPCTILYNGRVKNYTVKSNQEGKKYISFNGRLYHEDELPLGEEVTV